MSPLYLTALLLLSTLISPSLGQGYGSAPTKGKKHRTTTTTTLPPDIANLNLGQGYQPGGNPISSTPVPDNSLGSYNPPPQSGSGPYWWQNPDSPFSGGNAPSSQPAYPGGQPAYPGSQPGGQPAYPGPQPGGQPAYPGSQPGGQPAYPGSQPGAQPAYPGPQPGGQPAYPGPQPGGCGGGSAGGCGGVSPGGGSQPPINIQGNPFLSGLKPGGGSQRPPIQPSGQTITCSGPGYICAPKNLCRNGVVVQDGQGLFEVRSETQFCNAATQACCRLPSDAPSGGCGGYGAGGGCGGQPAPQPSPFPSQPPSTGHNNGGPGLVHIPPSPGAGGQHYPSASIPSPTYSPGTNGIPIGGSIYDTGAYPATQAPNQHPYTGPLNTTPHPGCAAALKCVQESYCTYEGVMSDRPVTLTREQYDNKVPLSDCADPDTGVIGKCCRDPNYKDPWPGGMMMKNGGGTGGVQQLPQQQFNPQPQGNECGPSASCQPSYQCDNQQRAQPLRGCIVPHDGSAGVCCSSSQPAYQYPTQTYNSPQYPAQVAPAQTYDYSQYPAQTYDASQYPAQTYDASQYPAQTYDASQYPAQTFDIPQPPKKSPRRGY